MAGAALDLNALASGFNVLRQTAAVAAVRWQQHLQLLGELRVMLKQLGQLLAQVCLIVFVGAASASANASLARPVALSAQPAEQLQAGGGAFLTDGLGGLFPCLAQYGATTATTEATIVSIIAGRPSVTP